MARPPDRARLERGLAKLAAGEPRVGFWGADLADAEAVRIAEGVKASRTLTTMGSKCGLRRGDESSSAVLTRAAMAVAGNGIGDLGAAALAEGMKESGSLTELRLGGACG
jgi:hypothetical protein